MLLAASVSPPLRLAIDPSVFADAACALGVAGCLSFPPAAPAPVPPPAPKKPALPAWFTAGPGAGIRILVSLPQQRAWVFEDGDLLATSPVSTGRRGHETPVGRFRILQKAAHHRSNVYSNAPMPFMQRLTRSGIAMHAGHLPGYPASHGCIRFPWGFARRLYGLTNGATRVTITRMRPRSAEDAAGMA
ncbi:MAG TPA: L,D-transpeptidase family protein [Allosphingosinicella sp.]|nr:L,D-transpeptidase family protein [Allosphingosinicella sp.]